MAGGSSPSRLAVADAFLANSSLSSVVTPLLRRSAAMTVGTSHFALRDLSLDRAPEEPGPEHRRDVVPLVAQVVEFEDVDVALTAIDTRVLLEVGMKAWQILGDEDGLPPSCASDLRFAVERVERALVRVVAITAPRLTDAGLTRPPCEGTGRSHPAAAGTVGRGSKDLGRLRWSAPRRLPRSDAREHLPLGTPPPRRRLRSSCCAPAMAIRAADVALCDLLLDESPRATPDHVANVGELFAKVVVFEDDHIRFTAVDAPLPRKAIPEELADT